MGALRQLGFMTGGLDSNANAYLVASGITEATRVKAVNTLVRDLKNINATQSNFVNFSDLSNSVIKGLLPFAGLNDSSQKFNLMIPIDSDAAHRANFYNTPTLTGSLGRKNGICVLKASSQYFDTHITPNIDFTNQNAHIGVFVTHPLPGASTTTGIFGSLKGSITKYISLRGLGLNSVSYSTFGDYTQMSDSNATKQGYGHYVLDQYSNVLSLFENGTSINTLANTSTIGANDVPLLFGCENVNGTASNFGSQSFRAVHWGSHITPQAMLLFYQALQKFKDSINPNAYFFGDSMTQGIGASVYENCFEQILSNNFKYYLDYNNGVQYKTLQYPNGSGQTSLYTDIVTNNLCPLKPTGKSFVYIWIGANDISFNGDTPSQFTTQYHAVIDKILTRGWLVSDIIILNIPPRYTGGDNYVTTIALFNGLIADITAYYNIKLIDLHSFFDTNNPGNINSWYADGLHPNDVGYTNMSNYVTSQTYN